jgi:two-component system response regulator DegU
MIVDDHSGVREMLRTLFLSTPGTELSECSDGKEALKAYPGFQPDWVVMDSDMHELDGLSATRQLVNRFPDARVLMVSEDDIEQLRRAARTAGACGFVTKDHLLQALREKQGTPLDQLAPLWMSPA